MLIGSGTMHFAARAVKNGIEPDQMEILEGLSTDMVFEAVIEKCTRDSLIVGMCNVHGGGVELARYFSNRATEQDEL